MRLTPDELLVGALTAFKQEAEIAAQRASRSPSPSMQTSTSGAEHRQQQPMQPEQLAEPQQQTLQQSSSLPDFSKGGASEQTPVRESTSQGASEPGPQEQQNWGVLRPTPQRIGVCLGTDPSQCLQPGLDANPDLGHACALPLSRKSWSAFLGYL